MRSIRPFKIITDELNRNINTYPRLYGIYKVAETEFNKSNVNLRKTFISHNIYLDDDVYEKEYLELVNELKLRCGVPNDNRKLWVTTHDGGKVLGFYEHGKWQYQSLNNVIEITSIVIEWDESY
ncbi:hypothetical protein WKH57_01165 [Niallia taxi]|uniref:hypothetical protein n=1 Tax=Niallia taxi TaxID=2499688 RepID=UPI003181B999